MQPIRIVLLEDNRLWGTGAAAVLSGQQGIKAVSVGLNGEGDFLEKVRMVRPHIAMFRLQVESQVTLRVVDLLKEEFPRVAVIALGSPQSNADVMKHLEAGVSGFIANDAPLAAIVKTIRAVASGKKVLPTPVAGQRLTEIVEQVFKSEDVDEITDAVRITRREQDIVDRIASGRSNREIALELNIAVHTVKSHVHRILEKLMLDSRLQLAVHTLSRRTDPNGNKVPAETHAVAEDSR